MARFGHGIQVDGDGRARPGRSLAALVVVFEDVPVLRAMRAVGADSAEFAVVVTVVAIGAEDLCAHRAAVGRASLQVQHGGQKAGLRSLRNCL